MPGFLIYLESGSIIITMIKKTLAILAVISFAGLAVFGFLGMADHGFNTCLIRAVHGGVCPGNSLSLLNFHLGALKIFSSANLTDLAAALFNALMAGLGLAVLGVFTASKPVIIFKHYFHRLSFIRNFSFKEINRWLIRHETSPTF